MLGWAAQTLPSLAMNVAVIGSCAIYLGWLSWSTLVLLTCVMASGAVVYRILIRRADRYLQRARETRDLLYEHFRALTKGMKGLKLHAGRRGAFFSEQLGVEAVGVGRGGVRIARR